MFRRLLVPLDGSQLAETVLPVVQAFAGRFDADVTLLHVVERRPPADVHGERHLASLAEAEAYLRDVAARHFASGRATVHVHGPGEGDVAPLIARHAEEFGSGLVMLCSHGRGGARDLLVGSVAQQVLAVGSAPVLLVKPPTGPTPASKVFACSRVLVPLDGSRPSEAALGPAATVARAFGAEVYLLSVVPTVATVPTDRAPAALMLPGATALSLEMDEEAVTGYLDDLAARLRADGTTARAFVGRGDPAVIVTEMAGRLEADLLVLATHGRSGMTALWAGSVATRIAARCQRPMLLVRAPGVPQTP
ncbi:MAG: universal stress protein [Armatimonadota bacterium]|nr:universal stress protein [Armatimonadota bacterium]